MIICIIRLIKKLSYISKVPNENTIYFFMLYLHNYCSMNFVENVDEHDLYF